MLFVRPDVSGNMPSISIEKRWQVQLPNGTFLSGSGDIPRNILNMTRGREIKIDQRWTATLPDGTVRSGSGEMPREILAMVKDSVKEVKTQERRRIHDVRW